MRRKEKYVTMKESISKVYYGFKELDEDNITGSIEDTKEPFAQVVSSTIFSKLGELENNELLSEDYCNNLMNTFDDFELKYGSIGSGSLSAIDMASKALHDFSNKYLIVSDKIKEAMVNYNAIMDKTANNINIATFRETDTLMNQVKDVIYKYVNTSHKQFTREYVGELSMDSNPVLDFNSLHSYNILDHKSVSGNLSDALALVVIYDEVVKFGKNDREVDFALGRLTTLTTHLTAIFRIMKTKEEANRAVLYNVGKDIFINKNVIGLVNGIANESYDNSIIKGLCETDDWQYLSVNDLPKNINKYRAIYSANEISKQNTTKINAVNETVTNLNRSIKATFRNDIRYSSINIKPNMVIKGLNDGKDLVSVLFELVCESIPELRIGSKVILREFMVNKASKEVSMLCGLAAVLGTVMSKEIITGTSRA